MKNINCFIMLFVVLSLSACKATNDQSAKGAMVFWGHHFSQASEVSYGTLPDQKMDIYSQGSWIGEPEYWRCDTIMHKTLVYIHGGGWLGGDKNQITPFILSYLERGWNVVCLNYRTGESTAPQAVDDCMLAISWLADHAKNYAIDSQKIVVSGESAGGHLALISGMLNTIPGSHPYYAGDRINVLAIINWFGITDIKAVDQHFRANNQDWNYARMWVGEDARMDSVSLAFSPINKISEGCPAILSIHGKLDTAVPYEQAVALHEKLTKMGVKNEFVSFDDARHLGFTEAEFQEIYTRIFAFLNGINL